MDTQLADRMASGGATSAVPSAHATAHRLARDPEVWLLVLLLVLATIAYLHFTIEVVRWNDPTAYVYAGMRIAESGRPTYSHPYNAGVGPYFTLHGFMVQPQPGSAALHLTHAVGLPVLLAVVMRLTSAANAALYVVPVLGVIGLVFLFLLGRMLFGRWAGLLAAGLLAFTPGYWFYSTETWSDVPATVFLLAGTVLSIHAARRNSLLWGALGGLSLGYACLIRYPSALATLPLALYLLLSARGQPKPRRAWAATLAGWGVFCGLILLYNAAVYGGPFRSGYSPAHGWVPWAMFSWRNFIGQSPIDSGGIQAVLRALANNMPIALLLALVGLWRMPRPAAALIGLNALAFSLLYAAYLWPSRDARFIMFVLPMVALAAAYTLQQAINRLSRQRRALAAPAVVLVVALAALPTLGGSTRELAGRNAHGRAIVARVLNVVQGAEPNSVWLSQKYHDVIMLYGQRTALYYALLAPPDRVRQTYDVAGYAARLVDVVAALLQQGTPVYLIKEPPDLRFRQGPIDPYPVLAEHYVLEQVRDDPLVYRVRPQELSR